MNTINQAYSYTTQHFQWVGAPILGLLIVILFFLEGQYALRTRLQGRWQRIWVNIFTSAPGFVLLRYAFIPLMVWLAILNRQWHFGVNYLYQLPAWAEMLIAFLILDYFIYRWHRLTHRVGLLWAFHKVHHIDMDMDVSTAFRFHFGELFLSAFYRGASVLLAGADVATVIVYEICFEAANNFHHSNLRLPLAAEKWLATIIVTPRMHGLHHSVIMKEKDSNWGTIFSFWDRLHGTFTAIVNHKPDIKLGEAEYQTQAPMPPWPLLQLPFSAKATERKKPLD